MKTEELIALAHDAGFFVTTEMKWQVEKWGRLAATLPVLVVKGYLTETEHGDMVWRLEDYDEACTYCDDGESPIPLYTKAVNTRGQVALAEHDLALALAHQDQHPLSGSAKASVTEAQRVLAEAKDGK